MKLKTNSTFKKRVRITATKKFKVYKASKQHLLINKASKAKHFARSTAGVILSETHTRQARKMMPYA